MTPSILHEVFEHNGWANLRLIDHCLGLTPAQLETPVPGTYGSILATLRHFLQGESFYLFVASNHWEESADASTMSLPELRALAERDAGGWAELLDSNPDPSALKRELDDDGYQRDAPISVRLAQAIHHANEHRTQVCTALTVLGLEPPDLSVWEFALVTGKSTDAYVGQQP